MKKIVLINGGRGATEIIPFLIKKDHSLTSIVNAYDDGKSTGVLRDYFKILGPSDIRKVQSLMLNHKSKYYKIVKKLFQCRFPKDENYKIKNELNLLIQNKKNLIFDASKLPKDLSKFIFLNLKKFLIYASKKEKIKKKGLDFNDLSLLNCIYTSLILQNNNNIDRAIKIICKKFELKSNVLVNSNKNRFLVALRNSGLFLNSEAKIVETRSNVRIKKIFVLKNKINHNFFKKISNSSKEILLNKLNVPPKISKKINSVLSDSDVIIFCPGTQHSSLYPTYLSRGFGEVIKSNILAKKIFITNIGADYETPKYNAFDYVEGAFNYLTNFSVKKNYNDYFDLVLINKPKKNNKINYVKFNKEKFLKNRINYIYDDFENHKKPGYHDIRKLYKFIKCK